MVVTGTIGDAALGLELRDVVAAAKRWRLDNKYQYQLIRRYLLPQPRNAIAEVLRVHATAAMDVSDGLVGDFGKLCAASEVSAEIEVARVPLSEAARATVASEASAIERVLTGGDDYEIVCTIPPEPPGGIPGRCRSGACAGYGDRTGRCGQGDRRVSSAETVRL